VQTDPAQNHKHRPWLAWLALALFALGLLVRLWHSREVPADVAYELDAAYRILQGQCPYSDFCFDQLMPIVAWRMLTLAVAPMVAALSGVPSGLADCFFNIKVLGFASVLTTSALTVFSYFLCWTIISRFGRAVFAGHIKWLILLAVAIANLAMGFEFGDQQHIFVLLFLPYFLTRWLALQGARVAPLVKILTAALAAVGASFSLLFLLIVVAFEIVEVLARRSLKPLIELTLLAFVVASAALWLSLLFLPKIAVAVFFGWILPLRLNALTHDSFSIYGFYVTPDRRPLFYAAVLAWIFAFGGLSRCQLLRPLASVAVLGLIVWMTLVVGLSADALILTYFTALLLTVESYFAADWITARYPRFFWRKKEPAFLSLVLCGSLATSAFLVGSEIYQRKLVKTAATRTRPSEVAGTQELASVIKENSKARASVLIINGKLRPAYPLLALCERSSCGYFLGTDILGTLLNIRTRKFFEPARGTAESSTKVIEKNLYARLLANILIDKPELICVQGGETEDTLKLYHIQSVIMDRYQRLCEAQYYSDRLGPRELAEFNYNYWVYKIKPDIKQKP
jgi:hypothetical protein